MAEGVVDRLEAVEVEEHQRNAFAVTGGVGQGLVQAVASRVRLGRPVSGSCWARKAMRASDALRSVMSENTAT